MRVEVKQKPNEEIFDNPIVSTMLKSATNNIEGTREFILPIVEHDTHIIGDFDIETFASFLSIEWSMAFRLCASPHTSTARSASLTTRHGRATTGGEELVAKGEVAESRMTKRVLRAKVGECRGKMTGVTGEPEP